MCNGAETAAPKRCSLDGELHRRWARDSWNLAQNSRESPSEQSEFLA
jgi:hypothetical protein